MAVHDGLHLDLAARVLPNTTGAGEGEAAGVEGPRALWGGWSVAHRRRGGLAHQPERGLRRVARAELGELAIAILAEHRNCLGKQKWESGHAAHGRRKRGSQNVVRLRSRAARGSI